MGLKNKFIMLVDGSQSMDVIRDETIDAFNAQVDTIKESASQTGQESTVSLYVFRNTSVQRIFFNADVATLKKLTRKDYVPDGMTPMLDAIGQSIEEMLDLPESKDDDTSVVLMCFTDGEENRSRRYKERDVQELLRKTNATDRWSHIFLVPSERQRQELARRWGVPLGNIGVWTADRRGTAAASQAVSTGLSSYFVSRAAGQKSTKGFFVTSMTSVSDADVKKMKDVSAEVVMWPVTKTEMISVFCERKSGQPYLKGAAFYELTEDETIQPNKLVLIMEKGGSAVYAGDEARALLGLTHGVNVRVRPGDHGKWRVFVQSTSMNRNTDPGTTVIYWAVKGHVPSSKKRSGRGRAHASP